MIPPLLIGLCPFILRPGVACRSCNCCVSSAATTAHTAPLLLVIPLRPTLQTQPLCTRLCFASCPLSPCLPRPSPGQLIRRRIRQPRGFPRPARRPARPPARLSVRLSVHLSVRLSVCGCARVRTACPGCLLVGADSSGAGRLQGRKSHRCGGKQTRRAARRGGRGQRHNWPGSCSVTAPVSADGRRRPTTDSTLCACAEPVAGGRPGPSPKRPQRQRWLVARRVPPRSAAAPRTGSAERAARAAGRTGCCVAPRKSRGV